MKRKPRFRFRYLIFALGFFWLGRWWFGTPSEEELRARFLQNRGDFARLNVMFQQDAPPGNSGLSISSDYARNSIDKPLPSERVEQYRALMKTIGVDLITGGKDRMRLIVMNGGFTDTSWSIGYAYSRSRPQIVVHSIYKWKPRHDKMAFAPLSGNWYLYNRR